MNTQDAAVGNATPARDKAVAISGSVLALALGSGLAATPAEATLVTTSLNVNVAPTGSYTFGPNGDEFTLSNDGVLGPVLGLSLQGNTTAISTNFVAVKAPASTGLMSFSPGDVVDATDSFNVSGSDIFFKPVNNVIYGLESVGAVDTIFGFVQIDALPSADIHIDGFAFETDPQLGATVVALPDTSVPEPGTLGLFATGAAGVLAARRRKKQKSA